jgi:hypothetical protein
MKQLWQPGIPMRFRTSEDGTKVLQQVWCKWALCPEGWNQTYDIRWEDVPTDIDDRKYWSKEE